MLPGPISDIKPTDLLALVENRVPERLTLDYKQELPGNSDSDRKKFLASVTAFANAAGGDLVFGVRELRDDAGEPTGIPEEIEGVRVSNADALQRQLEASLRDGVEPRVSGLQWAFVGAFPRGPAVVLRVPRSWDAPHMITFQNWSRFYSRSGATRVPLDVHELRKAFLRGPATADQIRRFHADRLAKIVAGEIPVSLQPGRPVVTIHAIPFSAFDVGGSTLNVEQALGRPDHLIRPLAAETGYSPRFNVDGLLADSRIGTNELVAYLQLFRTGVVESVNTHMFDEAVPAIGRPGGLAAIGLARDLFLFAKQLEGLVGLLGISLPIALLISIVGAAGSVVFVPQGRHAAGQQIDRDHLSLPDVVIASLPIDPPAVLRPMLDGLWRAAGRPRCDKYDEAGVWHGGV